MTESETPSAVSRKTSFTMRQRFTPARACSTRTRTRPSFRLVRFSAAVNAPPGGFFFRLAGLHSLWLVALEAAVLVQDGPRRIGDPLPVGDAFVRRPPSAGAAQEADAPATGVHDDHILVAVDLLPAAVVRRLFFRVFRPLAPPLGPVDDQAGRRSVCRAGSYEGRQQEVKFRWRQACEGQTPFPIAPEFRVGHHKANVFLNSDKVY